MGRQAVMAEGLRGEGQGTEQGEGHEAEATCLGQPCLLCCKKGRSQGDLGCAAESAFMGHPALVTVPHNRT